jgi:hypothetical protein
MPIALRLRFCDKLSNIQHSNDSITVQNHITFDNLSSVSSFLGKVGNPELGGLPEKFEDITGVIRMVTHMTGNTMTNKKRLKISNLPF